MFWKKKSKPIVSKRAEDAPKSWAEGGPPTTIGPMLLAIARGDMSNPVASPLGDAFERQKSIERNRAAALARLAKSSGDSCPSCRSRSVYHRNTRAYTYRCRRCGNEFN